MIRAVLLALLACVQLVSCGPEQRRAVPEQRAGSPALWAVDDAAGTTVGWLFGTIHALPDGTRWRTPVLDSIVDKAGVLVVEVRDLDPKRIAVVFERLARDRPGPPLAQRLAPEARRALAALLAREGRSFRRLDSLETWAAALAVAQIGDAVEPGNGTDKALLASFARRPVVELEGVAAQLAIFDALPERDQRAMLVAVIAEQGLAEAEAKALTEAWLTGDTASIERLARTGLLADAQLYETLLAKRNRAWADDIAALLEQDRRPLVAVGAAHLLGPDGLPAMLSARGYRVRRLQ